MPTRKKTNKGRKNKKCNPRNLSSSCPNGRDSTKTSGNHTGISRANLVTSNDSDERSRSTISSPEKSDSEHDPNNLNNSARKSAKEFLKERDSNNKANMSTLINSSEVPLLSFADNNVNVQGRDDQSGGFLGCAVTPLQEVYSNMSALNEGDFTIPNKNKRAAKRKAPLQPSEDNSNAITDDNTIISISEGTIDSNFNKITASISSPPNKKTKPIERKNKYRKKDIPLRSLC